MIIDAIIVLELVVMEFITVYLLSKRKHRLIWCLLFYLLITIGVYAFMYFVASKNERYGNGSGSFMYFGLLYFIPAMINYGGSWKRRLIVAFYAFSYGLAVFSLGIRFAYLFVGENSGDLNWVALIIQSILFAASYPFFYHYSKKRVMKYLDLASPQIINHFARYTITSFVLIISFNTTMTIETSYLRKLIVYGILIYFIILTYRIAVLYSRANNMSQMLSEQVHIDSLTLLENRYSFEIRIDDWLKKGEIFYVFYMDLDRFKSVNDRYGHAMGDRYLKNFSDNLNRLASPQTFFYRMSGDEFLCLTSNKAIKDELQRIDIPPIDSVTFLGFSFGFATFPQDAQDMESLLKLADQNMYHSKNNKHLKKAIRT